MDTQTKEEFRAIDIGTKDKFIGSIFRKNAPLVYNEKFKEIFNLFFLKHLAITAYNCMMIPIIDTQYEDVGVLICANKHSDKEYSSFGKRDEDLGTLLSKLVSCFFKLEDSQFIAKDVENKNWKMSELVDDSLESNSVKSTLSLIHYSRFHSNSGRERPRLLSRRESQYLSL